MISTGGESALEVRGASSRGGDFIRGAFATPERKEETISVGGTSLNGQPAGGVY